MNFPNIDLCKKQFLILVNKKPLRVGIERWLRWNQKNTGSLASTPIGKKVRVSTVFLPFEIHLSCCFETMIFGGQFDGKIRRYKTYKQALKGHVEAVKMVKLSLEGTKLKSKRSRGKQG